MAWTFFPWEREFYGQIFGTCKDSFAKRYNWGKKKSTTKIFLVFKSFLFSWDWKIFSFDCCFKKKSRKNDSESMKVYLEQNCIFIKLSKIMKEKKRNRTMAVTMVRDSSPKIYYIICYYNNYDLFFPKMVMLTLKILTKRKTKVMVRFLISVPFHKDNDKYYLFY